CRSVRGLLLCLQTSSLFELPGLPSRRLRERTSEAPTNRATLRPPDVRTLVHRLCHARVINKSAISKPPTLHGSVCDDVSSADNLRIGCWRDRGLPGRMPASAEVDL